MLTPGPNDRADASLRRPWTVILAGLLTAGLGSLALLGWVSHAPGLASFGPDLIPMAPDTACLFVLFGLAAGLRARWASRASVYWSSVVIGCMGLITALLLLVAAGYGLLPSAEHFGLPLASQSGGIPVGHMSPVTALGFLLASMSFLASLPASPER